MISKTVCDLFSLNKVICDALDMLKTCVGLLEEDKDYALRDVQRLIHTIKGSLSYFQNEELTQLAHNFETVLNAYNKIKKCPEDLRVGMMEKILAFQEAIECYVNHGGEFKETNDNYCIQYFFNLYPSIVKDLCLKLNKEASFELKGGDIEVSDSQWGQLFVQFIHVIRNSVAHGLETPEERLEQGKPREGKIVFKFEIELEQLKITLSDDGRGVDWENMAQRDASITSEQDAIIRILAGEFTSQEKVSEISGRGLGLSSVYTTVGKWGGQLSIKNKFKHGMSVDISVPLSKAQRDVCLYSA